MSNTIFITANWTTGALSQQTISRQYDNNRYVVQFIGYPEDDGTEELDLYLLVWMSTAPGQKPGEITPIQLNSDQWYISNYFTQQVQVIKFQLCVLNEAGTYETHSPIFSGRIGDSLEHNGTSQDIDVSTLFDAYREYVEELIIGAGAVIIDPVPTQGSNNAVRSGGVYESINEINGDINDLKSGLQHLNPRHMSGAVVGRNLFNKYNITSGFYVDATNGKFKSSSSYAISDYIPVEPSTYYEGNATTHYAWYDADKEYISGKNNVRLNETSPSNAAFLVHDVSISNIDKFMIARDIHGVARDFTPFYVQYPWHVPELNLNAFDFYKWGAYFVNMFNADEAIDGQYVEATNGDFSASASYFRSGFIPVEPSTAYKVSHPNRYAVYDSDYVYLEGANLSGTSGEFTTPNTARFVVVCYNSLTAKSSYILAKLSEYPSGYESYGIVVPWLKQETSAINIPKSKYDGKKLVCFGDSITNMGYINAINSDTGIEAINVGLSSGRYAYSDDSNQYVNAFAFHNIIDAINSGDWSIPDSIKNVSGYETQYAHIQDIKDIDFNTIDFVSIAYGTNDFSSATPLDNTNDSLDTNTFKGAIRYCLKTLTKKYPHLKIIGVTPCYRFWSENGNILYDSDIHAVNGMMMSQYVQAVEDVYAEYHLPVVNNYSNAGINKYNRLQYFGINDGLHPNAKGREIIGHRIGNGILNSY